MTGEPVLSAAAHEFLATPGRFGTLATIDADGAPLQAVVWYELRGDAIMINSLVGRRWPTNLLRDPRASFTVEDGYDYVTVRGSVTVIDDPVVALEDISRLARAYHPPEKAAALIASLYSKQQRITFLLHIRSFLLHS